MTPSSPFLPPSSSLSSCSPFSPFSLSLSLHLFSLFLFFLSKTITNQKKIMELLNDLFYFSSFFCHFLHSFFFLHRCRAPWQVRMIYGPGMDVISSGDTGSGHPARGVGGRKHAPLKSTIHGHFSPAQSVSFATGHQGNTKSRNYTLSSLCTELC